MRNARRQRNARRAESRRHAFALAGGDAAAILPILDAATLAHQSSIHRVRYYLGPELMHDKAARLETARRESDRLLDEVQRLDDAFRSACA